MWLYYFKLSWLSIKRTPVLSALMILVTAVGIAACLTTFTVYSVIASNPLAHKNTTSFAVQLDAWDEDGYNGGDQELPPQVTYRDAVALSESSIPEKAVTMTKSAFTVQKNDMTGQPSVERARLTSRDFFTLFDVDFVYGGAWDEVADDEAVRVVVINETLNLTLFNGEESLGKSILLDGVSFSVTGVVSNNWGLLPTVYDLNNNPFEEAPVLYIPFSLLAENQYPRRGNSQSWERQEDPSYAGLLRSDMVWIQMWVELSTLDKVNEFSQFIEAYIVEQKQLERFPRPLKYSLNTPKQWLEINEVVADDNRVLLGLSVAFLLVCLVNTIVMLLAKFLRKSSEAGVRRALGASRNAIFSQHIFEALSIGLIGGLLGLLFSYLGLAGVREIYGPYEKLAVLSGFTVAMSFLLAVIASVISGALPAWRISNTQPAHYLKTQ